MVAKITTEKDVYGALDYNQQKVDEAEGVSVKVSSRYSFTAG